MTKKRSTKRALLLSALSLLMCVSMLVGSTFAWFTDSVASGSNVITSGNLDIDVQYTLDGENWKNLNGANDLFKKGLWEPGHTEVVVLKVQNKGSLALKYVANMNIINEVVGKNKDGGNIVLSDILKVSTLTQATNDVGEIALMLAYMGENRVGYENTTSFKSANILMENQELHPGDAHYLFIKVDMAETVGNEANHDGKNASSIEFGINVLATQFTKENDTFGNQYDKDAEFVYVSNAVKRPLAATAPEKLNSMSETPVAVELPADALNKLPAEVEGIQLTHTKPIIDKANKTVKFEAMELVDQNGKEINLEGNTTPIEVSFPVPFANGEVFDIYHDGALIASTAVVDGKITYTTLHFCEIDVKPYDATKGTAVFTAEQLVEALEKGEDVMMMNDIKIEPAKMSNAYGTTGINVKEGQTLDGNGFTLDVKGAGGTWDSGICTTGGCVVKNIKVTGSFRGIFIRGGKEKVVLNNVTTEGTVYTISIDQASYQGLEATNCTFNGWTSFAATIGDVKFVNCSFGPGSGYNFSRPYAPTTYVNCNFAEGHQMDPRAAVIFEGCKLNGAAITADNLATLLIDNIDKATIK